MTHFNIADTLSGVLKQPSVEAPLHLLQEVNNARDTFKLPGSPTDGGLGLIMPMVGVNNALEDSGILPKVSLDFAGHSFKL